MSAAALLLFCAVALGALGCVSLGGGTHTTEVEPIRLSEVLAEGDPARRASLRLVMQGLDADETASYERAQGSYERAIQVDPTNPYAYLALARHDLDTGGDGATRALRLLDQAEQLFEGEGLKNPRIGTHLIGLRGRAFQQAGRGEDGVLLLELARERAPDIWRDGYLAPDELR